MEIWSEVKVRFEVKRVATHTINAISICAGIGGLDLGVRRAIPNARTVCYVEREIACCKILEARMQDGSLDDAPIWSDVGTFDGKPWRGVVDCIIAGIPCQGNSLAGSRKLEADPRNLWPQTRRIIREVGPSIFVLENVYGILVPGDGVPAPIVRILGELAEDGCDAEWIVLPASAVGASQKRERVFVLAVSSSGRRWAQGNGSFKSGADSASSGLALASPTERGRGGVREPSGSGGLAGGSGEPVECPSGKRGKRRGKPGDVAGESGRIEGEAHQRERRGNAAHGDGEPVGRADGARRAQAGSGSRIDAGSESATPSRDVFPTFPPGPGFGLDRVVDRVLEALESGEDGASDRFLAELAEWAKWQRILAVRPDLAPAVECEIR